MDVMDALKRLAAVAFLLVVGARIARKWWMRVKYDWHLIPGPAPYPLLGHLPYYLSWDRPKIHLQQLEWAKEHGRVFKIEAPVIGRVLFVMDPEQIQSSITGHGARGLPKGIGYRRLGALTNGHGSDNIFTALTTNDYWKAVRKGTALAFSTEGIQAMCPKICTKVAKLVHFIEGLPAGRSMDIQPLLERLTLDVIGSAGFDLEFGALDMGQCPLLDALRYCSEDLMASTLNPLRRWTKWLLPGGTLAKECDKMCSMLYGEYDWMLEELKGRGTPDKGDMSIWACLSRVKDPATGVELDDRALANELATFVFAGMDTTSHQAMWALYSIAVHQEVQQKIADELETAGLLAHIRNVEFDRLTCSSLMGLQYLTSVVKEAVRMFPAASIGTTRAVTKDGMKVCGYRLPAGTRTIVPIYAMCHAPWLFDDPETFKPDRWTKESGKEGGDGENERKGGGRTFWGFSDGPRDCIGQRLAMCELRFILAVMVARFKIRPAASMGKWSDVVARQYSSMVLCIDGGMWLHCDPR